MEITYYCPHSRALYLGSRNSDDPKGFPQTFRCQAGGNSPRSAIVSLGCELLPCPDYTGRDVTTCQVTLAKGGEAFLVSVYCDIKIMSIPQEAQNLLRDMPGANIVLCLDSNAHSKSWGSPETDRRGELMEDFIVHHDLILVNRGTAATFDSGRATSIIDITLCTRQMASRLSDWMVLEKFAFSDHKRIRFSLAIEPPVREKTWALKLADWGEFKSILRAVSSRRKRPYYWTPDTVDREVHLLYKDTESALSKVCPKIRAGQKYTNRWWTNDLTSQRRKARRLQKKAKDNPGDPSLWEAYKRARNDLVSSIRKAKRTCWRNFTSEASSPESMTKLTKALFKKGGGEQLGI